MLPIILLRGYLGTCTLHLSSLLPGSELNEQVITSGVIHTRIALSLNPRSKALRAFRNYLTNRNLNHFPILKAALGGRRENEPSTNSYAPKPPKSYLMAQGVDERRGEGSEVV